MSKSRAGPALGASSARRQRREDFQYGDAPRGVLILHEGGRMAAIITPSDQTDVPAGRATWPTRKLLAYSGRYRIEPPTDEFIVEVREDQAELAAEILKRSMIDGFA